MISRAVARHPAPRVEQRLAELVGQVVGQLGGVEVAAAYQQLAEVRVAPRPFIHLVHQPSGRWTAEQYGDLVAGGVLVEARQRQLLDAGQPAEVAQPVLELFADSSPRPGAWSPAPAAVAPNPATR